MSKKKNPVPRIGRTTKEGYQFPSFKPSKKFQKQFPRAAQKREAAIKKKQPPPPRSYEDNLRDLEERVRRGELKIRTIELPEGELIDKIAVLSNIYDIDNTADILDVDLDLLDRAIVGGNLNRLEKAELNEQYYHLIRDEDLQDLYNVDVDNVEKQASNLTAAIKDISDAELGNIFRDAVAEQDINLEKLDKGRFLFKNLSTLQLSKILEGWAEYDEKRDDKRIDLNEMFDNFFDDDMDIWDIEESLFWAWFREIFYS